VTILTVLTVAQNQWYRATLLYAGKAEVVVAYEYIVVMVAGCNQFGLLWMLRQLSDIFRENSRKVIT